MRVLGWRVTCQPLISKVRLICRACGLSHSTVPGQTSPPHCRASDAAECQEHPALILTQACAVCSGSLWGWLVLSVLVSWVWSVSSRKDSREWAASPLWVSSDPHGLSMEHSLSASAGGASTTPLLQPWALPSRPQASDSYTASTHGASARNC